MKKSNQIGEEETINKDTFFPKYKVKLEHRIGRMYPGHRDLYNFLLLIDWPNTFSTPGLTGLGLRAEALALPGCHAQKSSGVEIRAHSELVCVQIAIHLRYILGLKTEIFSNTEWNKILGYFLIWNDTWKKAAFRCRLKFKTL